MPLRRRAPALLLIGGVLTHILASPLSVCAQPAGPVHALSMHGRPALSPGFAHFPYVEPSAPKGGRLRLGVIGSFDSLNPFIIKGQPASGLRDYVFESLLERSADEAFSLYGMLAESVEVAPGYGAVTFRLRSAARFSDGQPVTAEDVAFSLRVLKAGGMPYMRSHYGKVARVEVLSPLAVRFVLDSAGDRELPLILGLMPILPRHRFDETQFETTTLTPVIGSGPYRIEQVNAGRSVVYRRNPEYWGRDLSVQRGRHNFDEVHVDYFRDSNALFEAFKAGNVDVRVETEPARWAEAYGFPAVADGRVVKRDVATGLPAGMSGIAFNTRRAPLDDARVRQALIRLFDANWINRNLYHGLYSRTASYFSRSELASTGRPADERERTLLAPFPGAVKPEVMEGRWQPPSTSGSGTDREALLEASELLSKAGFGLKSGRMVRLATGKPIELEWLASTKVQERLAIAYAESLKRLGIVLRIRQVDSAQYSARTRAFDYDLVQWLWPASLSPGNEQLNRWSSAAAGIQGSLNLPGVKSPAADAAIAAMLIAEKREDFVSAVRALDRVLISGDYVVPLFHAPGQWVAYWKGLEAPAELPLTGVDFDTWWRR